MSDEQRDELLERIAHVALVQMAVDGVSVTTRMLLDLHAWVAAGMDVDAPKLVMEWTEHLEVDS